MNEHENDTAQNIEDPETLEATETQDDPKTALADSPETTDQVAADGEADTPEAAPGTDEPAGHEPADKAAPDALPKPAVSIGSLVVVGILSLILGILLALPTSLGSGSAASEGHNLSGGVAATVDGVSIGENDVTQYVNRLRFQYEVTDADSWGQWLVDNDLTPETLRDEIIDTLVRQELVARELEQRGIEVSDEDVDAAIAQEAEYYGGEEGLVEALSNAGMNMSEFRANVKLSLEEQELANQLAGDAEVTDEQILEVLQMYGMADEGSTLEDVDAETVEYVRSMLASSVSYEAYSAWTDEVHAAADIQVNDMPAGLPYDVDVSKYEPTEDIDYGELVEVDDDADEDEADFAEEDDAELEAE